MDSKITVTLSESDLAILCSSLSCILSGVSPNERDFERIIGYEMEEVENLSQHLQTLLENFD
jgi:hypothetical protein